MVIASNRSLRDPSRIANAFVELDVWSRHLRERREFRKAILIGTSLLSLLGVQLASLLTGY
jgi:hypothetical protein